MKFVVYKDRKKQWRWKLVARNGRKIADSAESYLRRATMVKMVQKIMWSIANQRGIPIEDPEGQLVDYA